MSDDVLRNIYLHTRPEAYRNFLSDEWGERIHTLTSPAPTLSALIYDIMLEWRAASYALSLPAMIPEQLKGYHDSFVNTGEINTTFLRLAEGISRKLVRRVPELTSDPALIRRLQAEIVILGSDLEAAKSGVELELPLEDLWSEYMKLPAFYLCLWGSQRIAYVSIYNAYDNFISRLVCTALQLDGCRTGTKEFKKQLLDAFGKELKEKCWTSPDLYVAREVRHSLSHAGGRVTRELADIQPGHGFVEIEGRIQVTPDKTKALFALVKDCVYALAEEAVGMPQFK